MRTRSCRAAVVAVMAAGAVLAACGGSEDTTGSDPGEDGAGAATEATPDQATVQQWCASMSESKAALRQKYSEAFGTAPDGVAAPSSALISLDGSAAAISDLRDYAAGLGADAPKDVAAASQVLVEELDELFAQAQEMPDLPGAAVVGGMGAIAPFSVLDSFALEHCGETI